MSATNTTPADSQDLGFIHRYVPGAEGSDVTILLLHGTGGNEHDLIELGKSLAPGAALLSPRGKVLENGMPRFFRRLAEGVFDEEDLVKRTHQLADFVTRAAEHYRFNAKKIIALGYSNGANIAASLLLLRPEILHGAVLLRGMVPLQPEVPPKLDGVSVLIAAGDYDPLIPVENSAQLADMLKQSGAEVQLFRNDAGHQLTTADIQTAAGWLDKKLS